MDDDEIAVLRDVERRLNRQAAGKRTGQAVVERCGLHTPGRIPERADFAPREA
jgi:hypothetical protein